MKLQFDTHPECILELCHTSHKFGPLRNWHQDIQLPRNLHYISLNLLILSNESFLCTEDDKSSPSWIVAKHPILHCGDQCSEQGPRQ